MSSWLLFFFFRLFFHHHSFTINNISVAFLNLIISGQETHDCHLIPPSLLISNIFLNSVATTTLTTTTTTHKYCYYYYYCHVSESAERQTKGALWVGKSVSLASFESVKIQDGPKVTH